MSKPVAIILQPFGIGDVIFGITIARALLRAGYQVIWPVYGKYVAGLVRAYPDINFVDWTSYRINYDQKHESESDGVRIVPLRWANEYDREGNPVNIPFRDCMKAKYTLYGLPWERWREDAMFHRSSERECALLRHFGLVAGEPFNLINRYFKSTDVPGEVPITVNNGLKNIEMSNLPGFSIFDWAFLIESATTIHTVSTSIIYMLELLHLRAKEICIYIRRPNERSHSNYDYLLTSHKYTLMP